MLMVPCYYYRPLRATHEVGRPGSVARAPHRETRKRKRREMDLAGVSLRHTHGSLYLVGPRKRKPTHQQMIYSNGDKRGFLLVAVEALH